MDTASDAERAARKAAKKAAKAAAKAAAAAEGGAATDQEEEAEPEAGAAEEEREETEEERAARKAAKRARKEAKRAAREAAAREAEDGVPAEAPARAAHAGAVGEKRKREEDVAAAAPSSSSGSGSGSGSGAASAGGGSVRMAFYKKSDALAAVAPSVVEAFWQENRITVEDGAPASSSSSSTSSASASVASRWAPIMDFAHLGDNFPPNVKAALATFAKPSPIQAQAWPCVLSGRDFIGIAATGSGKTMGFLLPALVHIHAQPPLSRASQGPVVLVLSPTRELALQTAAVAESAGKAAGVRSVCIYGGVPKGEQIRELRGPAGTGAHIVVATPGRLLDLVADGVLPLSRVTYLVLDEADRMLDMGFEKDIKALVAQLRPAGSGSRQTVMFSATWPPAIQKIASEYLSSPVKVTIGSGELAASVTVQQIVTVVQEPRDREGILLRLLAEHHKSRKNRVIVFVLYKKEAARMETFLQGRGWPCVAIHGDMSQDARTRAFHSFRDGTVPLLVATDVAARGLDIPAVEFVINFTFPLTIEDYVHRIGRTGRAGRGGVAITLFTPIDKAHAGELVNVLRDGNQQVPEALLKFGTHVKKKEHALYGAHFKAVEEGGAPMAAPKKMTFGDDE